MLLNGSVSPCRVMVIFFCCFNLTGSVGEKDGVDEGMFVGNSVGAWDIVGRKDGLFDGCCEGMNDGRLDGTMEGESDGMADTEGIVETEG